MKAKPITALKATEEKTIFGKETSVTIEIQSKPEIVWKLLTNAQNFPSWNTTVESIKGTIAQGEKIEVRVPNEKRVFKLRISDFLPGKTMTWESGMKPFFKGVRKFTLSEVGDGKTKFTMIESMGGLMFPLAAKHIPDFRKTFEQYAEDLKKESESLSLRI